VGGTVCASVRQWTATSTETDSGRLLVTASGGTCQTREYDSLGRLVATIDGLNHRSDYVFDAVSRLLKIRLPDPGGPNSAARGRPEIDYTHDNLDPPGRAGWKRKQRSISDSRFHPARGC